MPSFSKQQDKAGNRAIHQTTLSEQGKHGGIYYTGLFSAGGKQLDGSSRSLLCLQFHVEKKNLPCCLSEGLLHVPVTNTLFISSQGNTPISHLGSWSNSKTKLRNLLLPGLASPALFDLVALLNALSSFLLYCYFSASSPFPCTFLPSLLTSSLTQRGWQFFLTFILLLRFPQFLSVLAAGHTLLEKIFFPTTVHIHHVRENVFMDTRAVS